MGGFGLGFLDLFLEGGGIFVILLDSFEYSTGLQMGGLGFLDLLEGGTALDVQVLPSSLETATVVSPPGAT